MKNNYFKSGVYHLFHGHETFKDPKRFDTFNKLKNYTKEDWLSQIDSYEWGKPVQNTLLYNVNISDYTPQISIDLLKSKIPVITICIVSYRRFDTLIKSLSQYIKFSIPINLLLWLNSYTDYTKLELEQIKKICSKLYSFDIIYHDTNVGTGYSRNVLLSKAYKEYDTPYIITTDDDILYNNEEELLIGPSLLDQIRFKEYGAVGIWCDPIYNSLYISDNKLKNYKSKNGFNDIDSLGAATMTIRRSILKKCNVDPNYIIGWVDADFSFEIKKQGYKIGLLCDERWKPLNIADKSDIIYKKARSDKKIKKKSIDLFYKKWGIIPEWRHQDKISEYNDN